MACTGAGVSGRYGDVKIGSTQVAEATKWDFEPKIGVYSYASNKTCGYKWKIPGSIDGTGTIEGVYDPANPIMTFFDVGSTVSLKLYITASVFYTVNALITTLKLTVDIDTGDIVKWSAGFEIVGQYTNPSAGLTAPGPDGMPETATPPAADATAPQIQTAASADIQETVANQVAAQMMLMAHELRQSVVEETTQATILALKDFLKDQFKDMKAAA